MKHAVSLERKGKGWEHRRWLAGAGALVLLLWLMTPAQAAGVGSSAGTAVMVQGGLSSALVGLPGGNYGKVHVSEKPDARSPCKPPVFVPGPPPWAQAKAKWAPGPPPWAGKGKASSSAVTARGGPKKGK
jgi:hypothetical protein